MKISFTWSRDNIDGFSKIDFAQYTEQIWRSLNFMNDEFKMLKPVDYKYREGESHTLRKESGTIIMRTDDMPYFRKFSSLEELKKIIMNDDQVTGYESLSTRDGRHEIIIEDRDVDYCNPSFAIRVKGLGFHDNLDNVTTVVFDDVE